LVKCELCGKDVMGKAGVFTEWRRTVTPYRGQKFAKIRGTRLCKYEPSPDDRKAHVYCQKCRKRITRMLGALRYY